MASVLLCHSQLNRMPDKGAALRTGLEAAGASVSGMACLGMCFPCGQQTVARVDGHPIGAKDADELVAQVREFVAAS